MAIKDKMQGKTEEISGKITGDKKMEMKGKLRTGAANTKDKAHRMDDKLRSKL